jgi:lipopolysaccharide/colanic/teichoic acid biosynthesis glycosyltransferase
MRRAVDIVAAIVVMVIVAPAAAIVGILVLTRMGRPVLFRQRRVGSDGALFTLIKFRTMHPKRWLGEPDGQRTPRLGAFLRASSLDELPQLWNILQGDMSFIGPRPTLPEQVERYTPRQRGRLAIRPGLTGWAQVNGRTSISWPERIEMDLWYIEHRSVSLDMRILLRTAARLVKPQGVTGKGGINPTFPVPAPAEPPEPESPAQRKSAQRTCGRRGADGAPRSVSRESSA